MNHNHMFIIDGLVVEGSVCLSDICSVFLQKKD